MVFPIREMVEMEIPRTKDCEAPLLDGLAQLLLAPRSALYRVYYCNALHKGAKQSIFVQWGCSVKLIS